MRGTLYCARKSIRGSNGACSVAPAVPLRPTEGASSLGAPAGGLSIRELLRLGKVHPRRTVQLGGSNSHRTALVLAHRLHDVAEIRRVAGAQLLIHTDAQLAEVIADARLAREVSVNYNAAE